MAVVVFIDAAMMGRRVRSVTRKPIQAVVVAPKKTAVAIRSDQL